MVFSVFEKIDETHEVMIFSIGFRSVKYAQTYSAWDKIPDPSVRNHNKEISKVELHTTNEIVKAKLSTNGQACTLGYDQLLQMDKD